MNWLRKLFTRKDQGEAATGGLRKRNAHDVLPEIAQSGEENPNPFEKVSYTFDISCLGNEVLTPAVSERFCVYCTHFRDPEFRDPAFPDGGGYCGSWNGAVGFRDSCARWAHRRKVEWWLSKRYMARHAARYPIPHWYRVFDDGPDGDR